MNALLIQSLRHIIRSRLLIFVIVFSLLVQFVGLKLMHSVTINYQGLVSILGGGQALFLSLILQLFSGSFLSMVYGIWMMPYQHIGTRGPLTYTLPVNRWLHPAAYGLSFLCVLFLQYLCMFLLFALMFGLGGLSAEFKWSGFFASIALQTIAFEAMSFFLGACSILMGAIPTFFLGILLMFLSGSMAILFNLTALKNLWSERPLWKVIEFVYRYLPPVGELIHDLKNAFFTPSLSINHTILWGVWLVVFFCFFRVRISSLGLSKEL